MKKNNSGYSMLELIMSLSVFTTITMIIFQAFSTGTRNLNVTYHRGIATGEARMGMERMTQELRNSSYSRVTVIGGNRLQFQEPTNITSDGVITWSGLVEYRLAGINSQQLLRYPGSGAAPTVVANRVTALQFIKNANPNTLTINITIQSQTDAGHIMPVALSNAVEFRN
ncbi:MAG: hypothetical protein A3C35_00475 [Omnitrophica bacterium RIFCSPHIGHO2_02_FULL_46_11]|nr:MAG: hypothetical protein A3C35_00475 [Omnitrophica bacterium RIFCSPHIGHO2_02_FULL_46_11]